MSLLELFSSTLSANPNVRRDSELRLREAEREPGFLINALELIKTNDDSSIQLAAAIYMKNRVSKAWSKDNSETYNTNQITKADKELFRPYLIQVLIVASPTIRVQFTAILSKILASDYPTRWPEFQDLTLGLLQSGNINEVYAGLTMLLELTKIYRWKSGDNRSGLEAVVTNIFPVILQIAGKLLVDPNVAAATMLVLILKTYKSAIAMELPSQLSEDPVLIPWGNLFLQVIAKEIPLSELPAEKEERTAYPRTKAKKWAFANLNRLFSRYAVQTSMGDSKATAFGKHFIANFAPEIMKSYLQQIELYMAHKIWLSERCVYLIVDFLEECIKPKVTWGLLKPHVPSIISHVVFPLLCLTQEDLDLWDEDPVEYIHKKIDVYEEYLTPDIAASRFLITLARKRQKTSFNGILQFINTTLSLPDNDKHPERKEAALRMIGSVSHIITKKGSPILAMMEPFLVSHVFPEFRSPHGYMRARACEVLNRFSEVDFEDHNNVLISFQCVIACLDDSELPVRCQAAFTLQPLLRHEYVINAMRPQIPQIMQRLMSLVNEVDADMLSSVMEEFVEQFSNELTPFAVDLALNLRETFMRLMQENEKEQAQDDDDDGETVTSKILAALGILNTLGTLILSVETKPELLRALEDTIQPILMFVLENAVYGSIRFMWLTIDLMSEVFEIIDSCTFSTRSISPTMWSFFPILHKAFKEYAVDYIDELVPPLDNYLSFGTSVIAENQAYKDMLFDYFFTVFETKRLGQQDEISACRLIETVLLNLPGQVDTHLFRALDIVRVRLEDEEEYKKPAYKVFLLEVIINAIYYNPVATLQYLEHSNFLAKFLQLWFDEAEHFLRVHDKTLSILALMKIVQLPPEHVPASFRNESALRYFMKAMLTFFQTLPEAIKRREEANDFDEDGSSVAAEGEGEWNEEDTWSDTEDTADVADEAQEYLDFLAQQTAEYGAKLSDGRDDEWEELEEQLREEPLFSTPLDKEDPYITFTRVFTQMGAANPQQMNTITSSFTAEEQKLLHSIVEKAKENLAEQEQAPQNSLNGD